MHCFELLSGLFWGNWHYFELLSGLFWGNWGNLRGHDSRFGTTAYRVVRTMYNITYRSRSSHMCTSTRRGRAAWRARCLLGWAAADTAARSVGRTGARKRQKVKKWAAAKGGRAEAPRWYPTRCSVGRGAPLTLLPAPALGHLNYSARRPAIISNRERDSRAD